MKKKFDYIHVQRKVWCLFWFEFVTIQRYPSDDAELFRETRDRFAKKYGADNVRLRVTWCQELYNGEGRRLL
jgi:hypothetical protein